MVLVDGGAELHCWSSDVTRTWPIAGKFTTAQREIYEIVLRVQKECIKVVFHTFISIFIIPLTNWYFYFIMIEGSGCGSKLDRINEISYLFDRRRTQSDRNHPTKLASPRTCSYSLFLLMIF